MSDSQARDRILLLLKTRGEMTTRDLADHLEMTVPGVRAHLDALGSEVVATTKKRGVGRPAQYWTITNDGSRRFPDTHSEMTVRLIETVQSELGNDALQRVIDAQFAASLERYSRELEKVTSLAGKLNRLAKLRDEEGYMAEIEKVADGWLLKEHHCPICAAATACRGFCKNELQLFRTLLGDAAEVDRVEYVLEDGQRCVYRITA